MNLDLQWVCDELISAFVESGAQGILIAAFFWAALKLWPQSNAATRHAAWFATLLIVAILPAAHFLGALRTKLTPAPSASVAPPLELSNASPLNDDSGSEDIDLASELPAENFDTPIEPASAQVPQPPALPTPSRKWNIAVPRKLSIILVAAWVVLATLRIGSLVRQLFLLRSIKSRATPPPEILCESFAAIAASMNVSRKARLLISNDVPAPMVVGFFRPAMLLPAPLAARSQTVGLEHLFRHELAHLARRDDWTNLVQQAVVAILFFHPGILFLSRLLTIQREIACDDHALAIGRAPREYALFLTEFACQMKGRDFTAAPAAWSSNSQLKERIGMILNGKRNASPRVSRTSVAAISATALIAAILTLAATPRFVVAAEGPAREKPEAPAAPKAPVAVEIPEQPAVNVAVSVEPVEISEPAIRTEISAQPKISVASISSASPSPAPIGVGPVAPAFLGQPVKIAPASPKIAMTPQADSPAEAGPRPHPKHIDRDDSDFERRLERLERMVEDLARRDKRDRAGKDEAFAKPMPGDDVHNQLRNEMDKAKREMERAHREADRAQHEAERAAVDQQRQAMNFNWTANQEAVGQMAAREALKARRQALESQRRQIDRELESLDRQMKQQDEKRADKEREKRNKAEEKEKTKKSRDQGDNDSDDDTAKAK